MIYESDVFDFVYFNSIVRLIIIFKPKINFSVKR